MITYTFCLRMNNRPVTGSALPEKHRCTHTDTDRQTDRQTGEFTLSNSSRLHRAMSILLKATQTQYFQAQTYMHMCVCMNIAHLWQIKSRTISLGRAFIFGTTLGYRLFIPFCMHVQPLSRGGGGGCRGPVGGL